MIATKDHFVKSEVLSPSTNAILFLSQRHAILFSSRVFSLGALFNRVNKKSSSKVFLFQNVIC